MLTPPEEPAEDPATPELPRQPARKRKHATIYGHGEPCLVWQVQGRPKGWTRGMPEGAGVLTPLGVPLSFHSKDEAARTLSLDRGNLSKVLRGRQTKIQSPEGTSFTGIYLGRDDADQSGEEWKAVSPSLYVSSHGRIQTKHAAGSGWSRKRLPNRCPDHARRVKHQHMIHEMKFLVGEFFFVGPHAPSVRWRSLDGDPANCTVANLWPEPVP